MNELDFDRKRRRKERERKAEQEHSLSLQIQALQAELAELQWVPVGERLPEKIGIAYFVFQGCICPTVMTYMGNGFWGDIYGK